MPYIVKANFRKILESNLWIIMIWQNLRGKPVLETWPTIGLMTRFVFSKRYRSLVLNRLSYLLGLRRRADAVGSMVASNQQLKVIKNVMPSWTHDLDIIYIYIYMTWISFLFYSKKYIKPFSGSILHPVFFKIKLSSNIFLILYVFRKKIIRIYFFRFFAFSGNLFIIRSHVWTKRVKSSYSPS